MVDIRALIDSWEIRDEQIYLLLAAGSSENLKPDLVMETFLKYANISDDVRFFIIALRCMQMKAATEKGSSFLLKISEKKSV